MAHSAWQRIMASFHSALRISPCKSVALGGMRAGKQPGASRPPWSKHSGLALITNARRRLRSKRQMLAIRTEYEVRNVIVLLTLDAIHDREPLPSASAISHAFTVGAEQDALFSDLPICFSNRPVHNRAHLHVPA